MVALCLSRLIPKALFPIVLSMTLDDAGDDAGDDDEGWLEGKRITSRVAVY